MKKSVVFPLAMKSRLSFIMLAFCTFLIVAVSTLPARGEIPPPPAKFVFDQPKLLSDASLEVIQDLIMAHDRATGDQVVLAIFNETEDENIPRVTRLVFNQWRIGKRGKDNGVLLALFLKNRKAQIEVGYGLEALLTESRAKEILNTFLIPGLQSGNSQTAVAQTIYEILRVLESPIIETGEGKTILARLPKANSDSAPPVRWTFLLGFALLALIIPFLDRLVSPDAHYSGRGWSLIRKKLIIGLFKKNIPFEGGGAHGNW